MLRKALGGILDQFRDTPVLTWKNRVGQMATKAGLPINPLTGTMKLGHPALGVDLHQFDGCLTMVMDQDEHKELAGKILGFLQQMTLEYGNEFITIGGWAVHAYGAKEFSLDGDAMVSVLTQSSLRDQFVVTPNPRLKKQQFQMPEGYDVDLYVEHQHGLRVPFKELQDFCTFRNGLFVPCLEHLLILKLEAARDRGHAPKGQKDREDIARLLSYADKNHHALNWMIMGDYLQDGDLNELKDLATSPQVLRSITNENHQEASKLKGNLSKLIQDTINARFPGNPPPSEGIQL